MTSEKRTQLLLDATAGIQEEYIEEAAAKQPSRQPWHWIAATAAVLALVIGGLLLLRQDEAPDGTVLPLFAVRAYAQGDSLAILESVGDSCNLASGESYLFPGKQTFMLEIYITNLDGSKVNPQKYRLLCRHEGRYLEPGDSDDSLIVMLMEEEGYYGFRIIGWCDNSTVVDITVRDEDDRIIYQRNMWIDYDFGYTTKVYNAYQYVVGVSTETLIDQILSQDYHDVEIFSSNIVPRYSSYADYYGGFRELELREDAPSLLLQRWLEDMETKKDKLQYYVSVDQTGLLGNMLAQDVYWNQLSEAQLKQIEQFGLRRWHSDPLSHSIFPGKRIFSYSLMLDGKEQYEDYLTVEYNGNTVQGKDNHLAIAQSISASFVDNPKHGWAVMGWFDEPTILTLTVRHKDGFVIGQEVILVTPTEDGYQIEVMKQ